MIIRVTPRVSEEDSGTRRAWRTPQTRKMAMSSGPEPPNRAEIMEGGGGSGSPSRFRDLKLCHMAPQETEVSPAMMQSWDSQAYPQPKWEEIGPQVSQRLAPGGGALTCRASHSPPGKRAAQPKRSSGWSEPLTPAGFSALVAGP